MIEKLLIANRGEIARRVIRGAHLLGISCVAVCSDPDLDAPYVAEADEFVRLPGATPTDTYLDVDAVVGAALRSGADAVHPGYGFLSEDAGFARSCVAAGLVFVGPPPEVIEAMGSKLNAKATMAAAGVARPPHRRDPQPVAPSTAPSPTPWRPWDGPCSSRHRPAAAAGACAWWRAPTRSPTR